MSTPELAKVVGSLLFTWCPGCRWAHYYSLRGTAPMWEWNGSLISPTLTPSYLTRRNHSPLADDENPVGREAFCCHSFLTDGIFQFLGDCTHQFAGQAVPVPEWRDDSVYARARFGIESGELQDGAR